MSKKPTHKISVVSGEGDSAFFTRVGSLWPTKSGGFSGEIRAGLAVSGRIVISEIKTDEDHDPATGEVNGGRQ